MEKQYTLSEISKHSTNEDLWVILSGCIYNVTVFSKSHPGGMSALVNNGGQDITAKFDKINRHWQNDKIDSILENLKIGVVKK